MKKVVLLAFVLCLLSTALSLCIMGLLRLHVAYASPNMNDFNIEVGNSAAYISMPFHYQSNSYYCGPAALEMVFDYYGEDIPQTEIADVARTYPSVTYMDELRRAAHFSNLSTSLGDEMPNNITGYSARKVGYAAFEQGGLAIDDLKALINKGEPLIVLMWWTPSKVYGHYRVVIGYNETHIIMHDPWNKDIWGGTYGGANTSMTYSMFLDLWQYSGNWGLLVYPWDIELQMPSTVSKGDNFEVIVNITYPCSTSFNTADYPASSCKATIELREGLELGLGETTQHPLENIIAGNSVQTSWSIHAKETGFHSISVTVTGIVGGSVWAHGTYPSYTYEDAIGASFTKSLRIMNQTYRVHNIDSGKSFSTIQGAINDNETLNGHTILVESGTYYEHVVVNKLISLIGENRSTTVIDGNGTGNVIEIIGARARAYVTGFTIRNGNNGIFINKPSYNIINNIISGNIVTDNQNGVYLFATCECSPAVRNTIGNNIIKNNSIGIYLTVSKENIIYHNNFIKNNDRGIYLTSSKENVIYHNNFVDNSVQAYEGSGYANFWDDGYPSGGNYWSNYPGVDVKSGPYQNETDSDGIGDAPYDINKKNQDSYPLMGMFSDFNATSEHHVTTICNSTISDFEFDQIGNEIRFNVTGKDGTTGFCRIFIPTALMNGPYKVFVNGTEVSYNLLPCSNSNHSYLYFTYNHSTQEVIIIPELPTWTSILLMLTVLTGAIAIYKRRLLKTPVL